ncbi:MAG: uroporphyrinogen decarboxylase family protein [Spirochaetales bacterium]|nr:uroporphyrinogen decarboxylase family protein [Spirochaetales bacterium]
MTSKERVRAFVNHQIPDRVPINYSANPGIDARLKEALGIAPRDDEGLRDALNVDFRPVVPPFIGPNRFEAVEGRHVEPEWGSRTRWVEHETGGYWDICDFPLKDLDPEMVANWPICTPDDYDYSAVPEICNRYKDYGLYVGNPGMGDILNSTGNLCGMDVVFISLALEDEAWLHLVDRKIDTQLEMTRRTLEAAAGQIDFLWMGEDLGTQHTPLISLDSYRKILRPRHQKVIDLAKSFDLPVMVHTCGSSSWVYEDFIEMGVTGVETLQPEAENMSPAYLKETFGDKMFFHGSISTGSSLGFGTPAEVEKEVRNTLEIMMPGGGYCLAPAHMIQDNTPVENVIALYEAGMKYGFYS